MNYFCSRSIHRWVAPTLKALKYRKEKLPVRPPDPRKSFVEWNYEAELYAFGKRLGEEFDRGLLQRALTEQSYLDWEENQQRKVGMDPEIKLSNNEEMVQSGHTIMENYILRYLTESLPKLPGPYVLDLKEYLMSQEILSHVSKNLGLDDIMLVPQNYPDSPTLVRGLKAVVSCIPNQSRAERFVRDLVLSQLCSFDITKLVTPKQPVEELIQALQPGGEEPEYRLITQSAVNTLLPVYHVGVYKSKEFLGRGFGESISIARDMAACDVLWKLWGVSRRKPFHLDLEPPKKYINSSINPSP